MKNISTRTILLITFLSVALVTPVFATVTYSAVQDTGEKSENLITNALEVSNLSEQSVEKSQQVALNIENIALYLETSDQAAAGEEADELRENFEEFVTTTNNLIDYMEESEEDFEEEKQSIRSSQEEMETLVQQILAYEQSGAAIADTIVADSQEELNRVTEVSTKASSQVLQAESSELLTLNNELQSLSTTILFVGVLTVIGGLTVATALSILISRPINQLHKEADKIKKEEFDKIELEKVNTRIREFDEFKGVMEDVVIALKSEFERDRSGMNDLALDLVDILSESIPRGVAESSFTSAADKAGVEPVNINPKNAEEIIKNLEVSTKGLGVDDKTFNKMRDRISEE